MPIDLLAEPRDLLADSPPAAPAPRPPRDLLADAPAMPAAAAPRDLLADVSPAPTAPAPAAPPVSAAIAQAKFQTAAPPDYSAPEYRGPAQDAQSSRIRAAGLDKMMLPPGQGPTPPNPSLAQAGSAIGGTAARFGKGVAGSFVDTIAGMPTPPGISSDPLGGGYETVVTGRDEQGGFVKESPLAPERMDKMNAQWAQDAAHERVQGAKDALGVNVPPPQNLPEKLTDVAAGLAAFIAKVAIAKKLVPGDLAANPIMHEAAAWELVHQSEGRAPGSGAVQGGTFGSIAAIPAKTALAGAGKVAAESAAGAGLAAVGGGDKTDVIIQALFPPAMKGLHAIGAKYKQRLTEAKTPQEQAAVIEEAKTAAIEARKQIGQLPEPVPQQQHQPRDLLEALPKSQSNRNEIPKSELAPKVDQSVTVDAAPVTDAQLEQATTSGEARPRDLLDEPVNLLPAEKAMLLGDEPPATNAAAPNEPATPASGQPAPVAPVQAGAEVLPPAEAKTPEDVAAAPPKTPEPPKPAPAAEAAPPERLTSARKAMMAEDRESLGLATLNSPERRSWQQAFDQAEAKGIPDRAMELAHEVQQNGRAFSDVETAGVVVRGAELKNRHIAIMDEIGKITDPAELKLKTAEALRIEQDFDLVSAALRTSGTEKGRALAAQKLTINQDFRLVSVLNRAKAAKGKDLKPAERAAYETLTKQLEEHTSRITQLETKLADRQVNDTLRQTRARKYATMTPEAKAAELQGKYAKLRELLGAGCNN